MLYSVMCYTQDSSEAHSVHKRGEVGIDDEDL